MQNTELPPCRLFIILAREAPLAVIFRRGPTKWTQLLLWHTDTDEIQLGQWFKGRIFERRCDLSPDGTKLIYFVSKINKRTINDNEYTYAWTAISKPPYLTALALWPKGDCWHGGGLFEDNQTVLLNHKPHQAQPHPNHLPSGLNVFPNPNARGENDPLYSDRLTRDGWVVQQEWKVSYKGLPDFFVTETPEIRVRQHRSRNYQVIMTRRIDGLGYRESFNVTNRNGQSVADVGRVNWVDWDQNGRLVVLKDGKLSVGIEDLEMESFRVRELADFNSLTPESELAPEWATRW
jgi:hypothetical protein